MNAERTDVIRDRLAADFRIVIADANHPGVIGAMQHLVDHVAQRGLATATLRDVFAT